MAQTRTASLYPTLNLERHCKLIYTLPRKPGTIQIDASPQWPQFLVVDQVETEKE